MYAVKLHFYLKKIVTDTVKQLQFSFHSIMYTKQRITETLSKFTVNNKKLLLPAMTAQMPYGHTAHSQTVAPRLSQGSL